MKKLLGILLTAVMVCTSMGVLGAGETNTETESLVGSNIIVHADFEGETTIQKEGIETAKDSTIVTPGTEAPLPAGCGTKCVEIAKVTTAADALIIKPELKYNHRYKISFWYKNEEGKAMTFFTDGLGLYCNGAFYTIPAPSKANTWCYYEMYVTTAVQTDSTKPNPYVRISMKSRTGGAQWLDEFKITEAENATISFVDKSVWGVPSSEGTAANTIKQYSNNKYITYTYGEGETATEVRVYGYAIRTMPKVTCDGNVRVITHYIPSELPEQVTLVLAVYKDDAATKMPILQGVEIDGLEYAITSRNSKADGTGTSFNIIQNAGVQYTDIDMSKYEAGSYLKAFMINSLTELDSISEIATLPAAQ